MGLTASTGLLLAVLGPFAPESVISVGKAADGRGGVEVRIEAVLSAHALDVAAVVGDLASYPQWFPAMTKLQLRPAGEVEASFRFPWPLRTMRQRFTVEHSHGLVRWRQLDGDFLRNEGSWRMRALGDGRTWVRYDTVVQFRRWVPAWLIARAERRAAKELMRALELRAQQIAPRAAVP
jgi:ribosome-associated toxin RatA of RatAB toxin-antitoxin module